jgi:transcription initiation factor TFIID subunit 5
LSMDEVNPKETFSSSSHNHNHNNDSHIARNKVQKGSEESSTSNLSLLELKGHSLSVFSVDQDKSNRLILSSSADESVRLWDTVINQCVARYNCLSVAWAVEFSPIGYYFSTANQDKTVAIYSTDRVAPLRIMTGHTRYTYNRNV